MPIGSLYLLKEAGALLAGASVAGAFSGGASSPPYMPRLPWPSNYRNIPWPLATPPIMTRIPGGTSPPPSAFDVGTQAGILNAPHLGEAGMLNSETGEAGSPPPSGSGIGQSAWDRLSPAQQTAVVNEMAARSRTSSAPVTMTSSNQAPGASPCPPGYVNLGGGEFPNNCQPAHQVTMTMAEPPTPTPAPPIMRLPPAMPPPDVAPPPPDLLPPSGGGGGGGGGAIPWGPLAAGGVVLAFLYAGRRKKGRRRR